MGLKLAGSRLRSTAEKSKVAASRGGSSSWFFNTKILAGSFGVSCCVKSLLVLAASVVVLFCCIVSSGRILLLSFQLIKSSSSVTPMMLSHLSVDQPSNLGLLPTRQAAKILSLSARDFVVDSSANALNPEEDMNTTRTTTTLSHEQQQQQLEEEESAVIISEAADHSFSEQDAVLVSKRLPESASIEEDDDQSEKATRSEQSPSNADDSTAQDHKQVLVLQGSPGESSDAAVIQSLEQRHLPDLKQQLVDQEKFNNNNTSYAAAELAAAQVQDDHAPQEDSEDDQIISFMSQDSKVSSEFKEVEASESKTSMGLQGSSESSKSRDSNVIVLPTDHVATVPGLSTTSEIKPDSSTGEIQSSSSAAAAATSSSRRFSATCDISHGRWVYDESYPLYRAPNCPFLDPGFRCEQNGRPNLDYMKYRWQPHECDLPRFNATDMLERIRNQRMVFIGDSLGRNHWESTLCMLAEGVADKSRIYEINGQPISKHQGFLSFRFQDYNCTVEYYRAPFLVPQTRAPRASPKIASYALRVDRIFTSGRTNWKDADILVLNAGHWWTEHKIFHQHSYFQEGNVLNMSMSLETGFQKALRTWGKWLEENLDTEKTHVIFRSFSPVHFRGGSWNKGGRCDKETRPMTDEEVKAEKADAPWTNAIISNELKKNKKKEIISFLDITTASNYRSDGHGALYQKNYTLVPTPRNRQDCSHFCLPGVPDTWSELMFATLLAKGKRNWRKPISY